MLHLYRACPCCNGRLKVKYLFRPCLIHTWSMLHSQQWWVKGEILIHQPSLHMRRAGYDSCFVCLSVCLSVSPCVCYSIFGRFCFKVMASFILPPYVQTLNGTTHINHNIVDHAAIACKVQLESCIVRVGSVPLSGLAPLDCSRGEGSAPWCSLFIP